jgi:pilus assembly protein Flp/PilA
MIQNAIDSFTSWYIDVRTRLRVEKEGATMVEYGLIVAAIAMVVVLAAIALGGGIDEIFGEAETCVKNPSEASCKTTTG